VIEDALGDVQSGSRFMALNKLRYLRSTIPVITDKLNALRAHFDRTADDQFYTQEQGRKTMQTLISVGIVFNLIVVIGFGLVILIERDLTGRLKVVVENTGRLANDQPLLPSVGGGDEIAHVDKVFREMAAALRTARDKERAIERLKQEFAAMISHDLRTPLTSIQLFLSMLSKGMLGDVNEKIKDKAGVADRNATRLIGLINDLLDLEKMEAGQLPLARANADACAVVNHSLESVRAFSEKHQVHLAFENAGSIHVFADEGRVIQVLVNLLSNAIKFSPSGGTVSVSVSSIGTSAKFAVADQGRGVPPELQGAIFDRFKQVDDTDSTEKKGTGLGLAICKAIVEQHGGTIAVDSVEGSGSTFWFTLPLAVVEVPEETVVTK
jgi:signal transduction histidine kinase